MMNTPDVLSSEERGKLSDAKQGIVIGILITVGGLGLNGVLLKEGGIWFAAVAILLWGVFKFLSSVWNYIQLKRLYAIPRHQLIAQMKSRNSQVAIKAVAKLRERKWEQTLDGVDLQGANLPKVMFGVANLRGANLAQANLQGARFFDASLQGADFSDANLQGANLAHANLQGANLRQADLRNARFNERTVLPDGANWTPDTDMRKFGAKV